MAALNWADNINLIGAIGAVVYDEVTEDECNKSLQLTRITINRVLFIYSFISDYFFLPEVVIVTLSSVYCKDIFLL